MTMSPQTTGAASKEARADSRREDILEAALEVFSEGGYANATTKEIARAAGLRSPALLYWYFDSKEDLLRATFLRYAPVLEATTGSSEPSTDVPPEVALPAVAHLALRFFTDERVRRVYRLWMAEWPRLEKLGISLQGSGRKKNVYSMTERYLARQTALGRLRPHDSAMAARAFVALIWSQIESRHLFPSIYPPCLDDERYVRGIVEIFLHGLNA